MDKFLIKGKVAKRQADSKIDQNKKAESEIAELCTSHTSTIGSTSKTDSEEPKIKKPKRLNKFNESWLKEPDFKYWLRKDSNKKDGHELATCLFCSMSIIAHKSDLIRHLNSERHKKKSLEIQGIPKIFDCILPSDLEKNVRSAELKLAGLLAEHNLPLKLIDDLAAIGTNIYPDSNIAKKLKLHRTKATTILKNVLGHSFMEDINEKLRAEGSFFSLVMDETTDQNTMKQCCFTGIMYNHDSNKVETVFLDMVELESGTAVVLYDCLKDMLNKKNIPMANLVGFCSDTTNVMVGQHTSVFANLKKDMPHIALIKCSCHMINLSSSKACLKLPRTVEDLLRCLGAHFSRSSHRQIKFKEFQEFFQVEIHKILTLSQTRWLSLKACVDRVLEQYNPLKAYLTESVFSDPSKTTEEMLTTMNNRFTLVYLEFISYVLTLLTDFNIMFQSETPLLHKLKPEVEALLKKLSSNYLNISYIRSCEDILKAEFNNVKNFIELEKIYIGIQATASMETLSKDKNVPRSEISTFYKTCLAFYVELTTDICKRFDFSDPLFKLISIVNPSTAQQFEIQSLAPVLERFPILNNFVTPQIVDDEWRAHAMLNYSQLGLNAEDNAENYWAKVFSLKNAAGQLQFSNLKYVLRLLLVLPFSNASVERKFSTLRNIKVENRNRLHTDTVVALMATREGIKKEGGSLKFNPTNKMLNAKIWNHNQSK